MKNVMLYVVVFDVVHQMGTVTLDLFGRSDGTKNYFRETLCGKHPETNTTDRSAIFDKSQCSMLAVNFKKLKSRGNNHINISAIYQSNTRRVIYSLGMRGN